MNRLSRTKSITLVIFTSPSPRTYIPFASRAVISIQRPLLYSTRTSDGTQKTQQSSKPRSQKFSECSMSFSQRVKTQVEALTVMPRPREIPFQAKVANFVNIIGHVVVPVKFETDEDGKHLAATIISHEQEDGKNSLLVPVVFEGDLAHVVACHVKANDCVFLSGKLSVDPMRLLLSEKLGNLHVLVENLSFVEGLKRSVSGYFLKNKGISASCAGIDKLTSLIPQKLEVVKLDSDGSEFIADDGLSSTLGWRESLTHTKSKSSHSKTGLDSESFVEGSVKRPSFSDSRETTPKEALQGECEDKVSFSESSKLEKGSEMSGAPASKNKEVDPWRNLIIHPLQWWDFREHKSNGSVKEKFPDFKHKETGESLWIDRAPEWALAGLGRLDFDVKPLYAKKEHAAVRASATKKDNKSDDSWKSLVENPEKWWDNRSQKRNPKAPDFKHKETNEVLWLDRKPAWALLKLPLLTERKIS